MDKNELLYEEAKQAINKLFSDTSVDKEIAIDNLEGLKIEIDDMIESLG